MIRPQASTAPQPRTSAAIAAVEKRLRHVTLAGEVVWIVALLLFLAAGSLMPSDPLHQDALQPIVDVPASLAGDMFNQGVPLLTRMPAPMQAYCPALAFQVLFVVALISATLAAVRGRWFLYLTLNTLMLIPGEPFGAACHPLLVQGALISGIAAAIRMAVKRQFKWLPVPLAAFLAVWGCQAFYASMDRTMPAVFELNDRVSGTTGKVQAFEHALDANRPRHPAAVDYVRAQLAYIRHDWQALRRIGPLDPHGFEGTPYKTARLRALAETVRVMAPPYNGNSPPSLLCTIVVRIAFGAGIAGVLLIMVGEHVRRRVKRLGKLDADLSAFRMAS